jgi:hypothetical protein
MEITGWRRQRENVRGSWFIRISKDDVIGINKIEWRSK